MFGKPWNISELPPHVRAQLDTEQDLNQEKARQSERQGRSRANTWDLSLTIQAITSSGLPEPATEHRFHPTRRWRFDIAWTEQMVALEVEGGVWTQGRHTRGAGFIKDMEKYNAAHALGWVVLRAIPKWLPNNNDLSIDGTLLDQLTRLLTTRRAA